MNTKYQAIVNFNITENAAAFYLNVLNKLKMIMISEKKHTGKSISSFNPFKTRSRFHLNALAL